jgi:hypothetical protein
MAYLIDKTSAKRVFWFVGLLTLSDPKSNPASNIAHNTFPEITAPAPYIPITNVLTLTVFWVTALLMVTAVYRTDETNITGIGRWLFKGVMADRSRTLRSIVIQGCYGR